MRELEIKKHSFEVAKSNIQKYAESAHTGVTLPRVKTDAGLFGWRDHKVTGEELNECMGEIQTSLISLNNASNAIISEFKEVYNAFETLDKDYIGGIILSINAAKKASDDAKQVSNDIAKTIKALKITVGKLGDFQSEVRLDLALLKNRLRINGNKSIQHIDDIDSIWEDVQKHQQLLCEIDGQLRGFGQAMSNFNRFKNELDGFRHLPDIDLLWSDFQMHYENYKRFYDAYNIYKSQIGLALDRCESQINELESYKKTLEQLSHLQEIDDMWNLINVNCALLEEQKKSINELAKMMADSLSRLQGELSVINEFKVSLEQFRHLNEIDVIWDDVVELKKKFAAFQQKCNDYVATMAFSFGNLSNKVEMLSSDVVNNSERISNIDSVINMLNQRIDTKFKSLSHRIRVNHIIAASSIILLSSLLILNLMNII